MLVIKGSIVGEQTSFLLWRGTTATEESIASGSIVDGSTVKGVEEQERTGESLRLRVCTGVERWEKQEMAQEVVSE